MHIRDVLAAMAAGDPELIVRFGGHARAAGLTLKSSNLEAFRAAFTAAVEKRLTPEMLDDRLVTDGTLDASQLNLETALCLRDAGPWGPGFEAPLFHGRFKVLSQRILKGAHLKMAVCSDSGQAPIDAIAFNQTPAIQTGDSVCLVYRLEMNHFRGMDSANLIVETLVSVD